MRVARFQPVVIFLLLATALITAAWALNLRGYSSASDLDLWGRALLANSGLLSLEDIVTAYPPLPYIGTIAFSAIAPGLGETTPFVFSALLAAGLPVAWFVKLRGFGYGLFTSLFIVLVMVLNPQFLRAVAEGPGFMLLHWGIWLLALGMFNLRRGHRVNDIILVSLALILISLSHPFGMVLAFASLPFIALVIPPDQLRASPREVFLVLLFPLLFTLASFAYVNWVFAGDPLHFIATVSRETAGLGAVSAAPRGVPFLTGMLAALAVIAACPIGIALLVQTRRLPPISFAVTALLGTLVAASLLAALLDVLPSIMLVGGLGVTLGVACASRWPRNPARNSTIAMLLFGGMMGSIVVTLADSSQETGRWLSAIAGNQVVAPDTELAGLGYALEGYDGILFDAEAAPSVVALRGEATGMWTADTTQFQFAGLQSIPKANIVVVRGSDSGYGVDRVGRIFLIFSNEARLATICCLMGNAGGHMSAGTRNQNEHVQITLTYSCCR
ncbi:hypothetical protein [Henriciella sp.]|uniref:hypothetical protein n=1 Tax=Henriciella sp. TaxID=1968823 RepID=UPI0026137054|nr:hypothetical protein [Henriciella sp.]